MPALGLRTRLGLVVSACAIACAILASRSGRASLPAAGQDPDKSQFKFLGAAYCKTCHEKGVDAQPQFRPSEGFVQLTEYDIWANADKHSRAHAVLEGNRGIQMGDFLGIRPAKDASCLNCHSMNIPDERRGNQFEIKDGVSCDGCHGPAQKWGIEHSQIEWRGKSAAQKAELGMVDMRQPVRRSEMCLSCHIGNAKEGKVVTHAMYAAGHPPLFGFEIATFSENLPPHWLYMDKKSTDVQKQFNFDPKRHERAELVLVGTAVAVRESARLLADESAADNWPEFAQFDCYACHHELQRDSWRRELGYTGTAGRPQPRPWPTALMELAIRHAAPDQEKAGKDLDDFRKAIDSLHRSFNAQPFGGSDVTQTAAVASSASDLADWSEQLIARLKDRPVTHETARDLLRQLCTSPRPASLDYDSARQIAWAIQTIYETLTPKPAADEEIHGILDKLDKELHLALPSGRTHEIMDELPHVLEAVGRYDPRSFQKHLAELAKLLPER